jgi:hypothetical protein
MVELMKRPEKMHVRGQALDLQRILVCFLVPNYQFSISFVIVGCCRDSEILTRAAIVDFWSSKSARSVESVERTICGRRRCIEESGVRWPCRVHFGTLC